MSNKELQQAWEQLAQEVSSIKPGDKEAQADWLMHKEALEIKASKEHTLGGLTLDEFTDVLSKLNQPPDFESLPDLEHPDCKHVAVKTTRTPCCEVIYLFCTLINKQTTMEACTKCKNLKPV